MVLAPSKDQRIRCVQGYFHIFATEERMVTSQMKRLQDMCQADINAGCQPVYNIYKPVLMDAVFEKDIHLGGLIYGPDVFERISIRASSAAAAGPLEAMYAKAGLLNSPTHLCEELYTPAFPPGPNHREAKMANYTFRIQTKLQKKGGTKAASRGHRQDNGESDNNADKEGAAIGDPGADEDAAVPVSHHHSAVWTCVPPSQMDIDRCKLTYIVSFSIMAAASFKQIITAICTP
ncbi:hypothetical protein AURDEDRAFT_162837 [Auricularia subglabra TFB-10046 SS5]|nr:hypothetical protein AURDEDRAFT_162837 [Auricularia subglabra TFB-10046 SS5]